MKNKIILATLLILSITKLAMAQDVPTTEADVQKAIADLRPQAPSAIAPGEYSFIQTTQAVESSPAKVLAEDYFWIRSKYETQNSFTFRVHHQNVQYTNGSPFRRDEERDLVIDKERPAHFSMQALPIEITNSRGDFYNLKKSQGQIATPEYVLKRKDCGGLRECPKQLAASMVEFDYDEFDGYGRLNRLHYTYWGSNEVPYMSSPLKGCFTGPFDYQGYTLKATRCSTVLDFSRQ